ncbi:hypothetical protein Ddc_04395 [Ditylenchus destructor]|nr:hypothetical protein Ddc_04395 [Ditylenchus destructor]
MTSFIFALVFFGFLHASEALRCYQGQQNSTAPIAGVPTECPIASVACTKIVEPSLMIATRGCQSTNCTLNGISMSTGVCQNSTAYPYSSYCCCYGDACNSSPTLSAISSTLSILLFSLMPLTAGYLARGQ